MKESEIREQVSKEYLEIKTRENEMLKDLIEFMRNDFSSYLLKIDKITQKRREFIEKNTKKKEFTVKLFVDGYHFYKTSKKDTKELIGTGKKLEIISDDLTEELKKGNLGSGINNKKINLEELNEIYKFNKILHSKYSKVYLTSILSGRIKRDIEKDIIKYLTKEERKSPFLLVDQVEYLVNVSKIPVPDAPTGNCHAFKQIHMGISSIPSFTFGKTPYVEMNYDDKEYDGLLGNLLDLYNKYTKKITNKEFNKPVLKPFNDCFDVMSNDEHSFDHRKDDLFFKYLTEKKYKGLLQILNSLPENYGLEFLRESKDKYIRIDVKYDISFFRAKNNRKKHQDAIKFKESKLAKNGIKKSNYTKFLSKNSELLKTNKCLLNSYELNQSPSNLKDYDNYYNKLIKEINDKKNFTAREVLGNQKVYIKNTYDNKHLYFERNEKQVDALLHSNVTSLKDIKQNQFVCLIINDEDIIPAFEDAKKEMGSVLKLYITSNDIKKRISREIKDRIGDYLIYPKEEIIDWIPILLTNIMPTPYPKFSRGILNPSYSSLLKDRIEEKRNEIRKKNKKKSVIELDKEIDLSKIDENIDSILKNVNKIVNNYKLRVE